MSDFLVTIAVALFNSVPYVASIIVILFALNIVRLSMVARRRRVALARRTAAKNSNWNMFGKTL